MVENKTKIILTAEDHASAVIGKVGGAIGGLANPAMAATTALSGLAGGAALLGMGAIVKSAVNAADGLHDLSQRTGVAVKGLAAYKLAAEQSGTSLDSVARGMKSMATAMIDNKGALKAAGITATETDAAMRQLADLFADLPDGAQKSALATKLLGKAGQDLIPVLNLGSRGMDESAQAAARYGNAMTLLAPQADSFNDSLAGISLNLQAMGAELANELMPTLNQIAREMENASKASGEFSTSGSVLQTTLQTIAVLGLEVSFVIGTLVKDMTAFAEITKKVATLDIQGALSVKMNRQDEAKRERSALDAAQARILNPIKQLSGPSTYDARDIRKRADAQIEAQKRARAALDESSSAAAAKKAATEAAQLEKEIWNNRLKAIDQGTKAERQIAELAHAQGLTDASEHQDALYAIAIDGLARRAKALQAQMDGTTDDSTRAKLAGELQEVTAAAAEAANGYQIHLAKFTKARDDFFASGRQEYARAAADEAEALLKSANAMEQENASIGQSADALAILTARRYDDKIALARANLEIVKSVKGREGEAYAIEQQIDALNRLKSAEIARPKLQEQSRAWEQFSDDIERSLTDALYRAFENGKDFGENFIDTLKNTLKSAVLKIVIQAIVDPVTGGIKTLLGGGSEGGAGGAVSSALNIGSTLSTLKTLWTNLGPIANGSYVANQFGSLANSEFGQTLGLSKATDIGADGKLIFELSESGASLDKIFSSTSFQSAAASIAGALVGGAIAGDYRINQKVGMANIGAAIGSFFGPVGGFVGGVLGGLADRAFGRGPKKIKAQGIEGTFSGLEFEGRNFADWKQKGGWFRSSKRGTNYSALDGAVKEMMGNAFAAVKIEVGLLAQSLGAPTAAIANYSKYIRQSLDANSFQTLLDKMGGEMAAFALAGTDFAKEGETALVTLRRLSSSFGSVNTWLKRLQQTTLSVSVASGDAASQLLDLFGGLDKFTDAQVKYYDLFYTEQEKYNAMQLALADTFAALGLAVPNSKQAFKDLLASIDLTNAGGREAYKTLTDLAPTFAEAVVAIEAHAIEVAGKLLAAYTGDGTLVPALVLIADASAATALDMTTSAGTISALFLDLASGLLNAGVDVGTLNTALTDNQLAAATLASEIDTIGINSRSAQVDIAGLSAELAKVDTATFVATIGGILQSIAKRFETILGAVARERVAVREAAIRILNPTPLTAAAIADSIAAATPSAPTRTALYTANNAVTAANATATAAIEKANAARATQSSAIAGVEAGIGNIWALAQKWGVGLEDGAGGAARFDVTDGGLFDAVYNAIRYTVGQEWRPTGFKNEFYQAGGVYDQTYGQSGTLSTLAGSATAADAAAVAAANALASAQTTATKAQLDYVAALQTYAVNAEKSVATLGRLREETVRWYDEQKRIADLMKSIATNLRGTVEQIKFSQLSDAQKYATLDAQFNTAYSLALATTGETLAGYGDKLNSLLGPAIEAAQNALSGSEAAAYTATALARAEAIAGRLETLAPAAFEQTSLDLLGQIDASLLALESVSIETSDAVVDAIEASKELTAAGLRAIVAALTGEAVPAFAAGGYHDGGLRLVGEHGPELEATGASRIWSAADTRRIMQGGEKVGAGEAALLMELSALRAEVVALRAETRATAVNTGKSARFAERWDVDGLTVRNDADTPLITEAAA